MNKTVDSYKFISGITSRMVKTWIKKEPPREIPWTALSKSLANSKIAVISSGAIALKSDEPFDQDGERRNPWWGDPSYRVLPRTATSEDIRVYHLHIDPQYAESDLNTLLPLDRLAELQANGEIGQVAESHYSFMGYTLQPEELLNKSVPAIIDNLQAEEVDLVLLVPA